MGEYERKLMEQLDAQEIVINRKEKQSRGYDYLGDGAYTRRSGCTDEEDDY